MVLNTGLSKDGVSQGMFKEPHAVVEFQKLKPIIKSQPLFLIGTYNSLVCQEIQSYP